MACDSAGGFRAAAWPCKTSYQLGELLETIWQENICVAEVLGKVLAQVSRQLASGGNGGGEGGESGLMGSCWAIGIGAAVG